MMPIYRIVRKQLPLFSFHYCVTGFTILSKYLSGEYLSYRCDHENRDFRKLAEKNKCINVESTVINFLINLTHFTQMFYPLKTYENL